MYCQFSACRTCCQTFLLNENIPKCMSQKCGREWTCKFIRDSFTCVFINGPYKHHREHVLLDRERALLPATQPYAEAKVRIQQLDIELARINIRIRELEQRKTEIYRLKQGLDRNPLQTIADMDADTVVEASIGGGAVVTKRHFIKGCPVDDCRGFLSSQWKCGLCDTWSCPDCHMVIGHSKDTPHTCDPNNVESAKLLQKETKPCPKCSASIFKIDGCDQMWCTQCHTAFSWKTGNIETRIHNPHYYDWLRKTQGSVPRDPNDIPVPCGEIQFGRDMVNTINHFAINNSVLRSKQLDRIIRMMIHHQEVTLVNDLYEDRNRSLRIRYLMKDIDENEFKKTLQKEEKNHNRKTERNHVIRMVTTASGDIFNRFIRHLYQNPNTKDMTILDELDNLRMYANEMLSDIQHTYAGHGKFYLFNEYFSFWNTNWG